MHNDEDGAPLKTDGQGMPRNLEPMSIEELEHYISQLNNEIERCRQEIDSKRKQQQDAASIFKL